MALGCVIAVDLLFLFSMAAVVHLSAAETVPGQVAKSKLCLRSTPVRACARACVSVCPGNEFPRSLVSVAAVTNSTALLTFNVHV